MDAQKTDGSTRRRPHYDIDLVRQAAQGRWPEILSSRAAVPSECLTGKPGPCPKCGGTDRFRLIDAAAGSVLCNQCFRERNGDGFAAYQWATGKDFPSSLADIADYLGIAPEANGHAGNSRSRSTKPTTDPAESLKFQPDNELLISLWTRHKPPVTPAAVKLAHGRLATHTLKSGGFPVIALPVWGEDSAAAKAAAEAAVLDQGKESVPADMTDQAATPVPVGYALYHTGGQSLPIGENRFAKIKLTKGSRPGWIGQAELVAATTTETVWLVEGCSDLLTLLSLDLPAGHAVISHSNGAGAKLDRWQIDQLRGRRIVIIHDSDAAGEAGSAAKAATLAPVAAEVRIVRLPYPVTESHGHDLRDWINEGHTIEQLIEIAAATEPIDAAKAAASKKPRVIVGVDEDRVTDEALAGLAHDQTVFRRGTTLVTILRDIASPKGIKRPTNSPRISTATYPIIRERLAASVEWIALKATRDGYEEVPAHPPLWATQAALARGSQFATIRLLEGVVEFPAMRSDGTIISQRGYDAATSLFYEPNCDFSDVAENPTLSDASQAINALSEVVVDFPFEKPHHKSAWLASVITPFVRFAYHGPTPLFLVEANTPGTGKGLLCDATGIIVCGRPMSRMSYPNGDDEMRKNITSTALAGDRLVLIDNISTTLGLPSLDAALTASTWRDRMLGKNETTGDIPLTTIWYATGNNVALTGDIARRICHIRLSSPLENPEERTGFTHPDLLAWIRDNRGRLAAACLTVVRAYMAVGRPAQNQTPWGSYEAWSDLVRSALVWAGQPDPATAKRELITQSDRDGAALRGLIEGWQEIDHDGTGLTAAKAIERLDANRDQFETLRAALQDLLSAPPGKLPTSKQIGTKLRYLRGRVIGGKFFDSREIKKSMHWFVCKSEEVLPDSFDPVVDGGFTPFEEFVSQSAQEEIWR